MRYSKLLSKLFKERSKNDAQVAIALVAGLAAGAVISILFAPASGSATRRNISGQVKGLGNNVRDKYSAMRNKWRGVAEEELAQETEVPHFKHRVVRKKKSDIDEILHEAHLDQHHNEQSIG